MTRRPKYRTPEPWAAVHDAANLTSTGKPHRRGRKVGTVATMLAGGFTHLATYCETIGCGHKADLPLSDFAPETTVDSIYRRLVCTRCISAGRPGTSIEVHGFKPSRVPSRHYNWPGFEK